MRQKRPWLLPLIAALLALAGCQAEPDPVAGQPAEVTTTPTSTPSTPASWLMPDLLGLPSAEVITVLGDLQADEDLDMMSMWTRPVFVGCDQRPGTIARQSPAPGTTLTRGARVEIREAAVGVRRFRGPCEPADGDLGPVTGPDSAIARQFYRFSADPSLGAPFANGDIWTGIEKGPTGTTIGQDDRDDLASWRMGAAYAERSGPFSVLDVLAESGGYYELHDGVVPTCSFGNGEAPPELAALRAISLTAPTDTVSACMQWWSVTLFLDEDNLIRGAALRLGAP